MGIMYRDMVVTVKLLEDYFVVYDFMGNFVGKQPYVCRHNFKKVQFKSNTSFSGIYLGEGSNRVIDDMAYHVYSTDSYWARKLKGEDKFKRIKTANMVQLTNKKEVIVLT